MERGEAYTSFCQFFCNLVYLPLLLDTYGHFMGATPYLYVLLFPFNIYLLEIVVGYYCMWLYGFNPAWNYRP